MTGVNNRLQSMIQANRDKHKRNALTNRELGSLLGVGTV